MTLLTIVVVWFAASILVGVATGRVLRRISGAYELAEDDR